MDSEDKDDTKNFSPKVKHQISLSGGQEIICSCYDSKMVTF